MIKETITVEIYDIDIGRAYFCFKYRLCRGDETHEDLYVSDHCYSDIESFKEVLFNGYAVDLVLESMINI